MFQSCWPVRDISRLMRAARNPPRICLVRECVDAVFIELRENLTQMSCMCVRKQTLPRSTFVPSLLAVGKCKDMLLLPSLLRFSRCALFKWRTRRAHGSAVTRHCQDKECGQHSSSKGPPSVQHQPQQSNFTRGGMGSLKDYDSR